MKARTMLRAAAALFAFSLASAAHASPPAAAAPPPDRRGDRLIVHEWGTFTSLLDERGRQVPGINTDDEPLPSFVHGVHGGIMQSPSEVPPVMMKGVSRVHPDVVVRLETPVLYFYPPKGVDRLTADVSVRMNGGWLTQFYPDAKVVAPGVRADRWDFGPLTPRTVGTLDWQGLSVGGTRNGPDTDSKVWLAPRAVSAASVTTRAGEAERYLFYRGVGKFPSPVTADRDPADAGMLRVSADFGPAVPAGTKVGKLWLVEVRADGAIAFLSQAPDAAPAAGRPVATFRTAFKGCEYEPERLAALRTEMHAALVADGLFPEEAEAMLNTWEVSYFKRPGLRLFYMVPKAWTEATLPLTVTAGALTAGMTVERAMIGRVEIVTPGQRALLKRIGQAPPNRRDWLNAVMQRSSASAADVQRQQWFDDVFNGRASLLTGGIDMPDEYRAYLELGRFRNALLLDEQARNPNPNLAKFIDLYDLKYAEVAKEAVGTR